MDISDIESSCASLGVPQGIIEALGPLQPKLSFHNEDHTVNQTTRSAIRTIRIMQDFGLDPNSRTIIPATIGHDVDFDKPLDSNSGFKNKEDRSAESTIGVLSVGFGFKNNEIKQIKNNILATNAGSAPKHLEGWITRMSDVQNFGDPYQAFVANGARIALETMILDPNATLSDAVTVWYFIGNTILPQYIDTRVPLQVRDIGDIPGSNIWKEHARENQRRLIAEKPTVLKKLLLCAHDDFIANVSLSLVEPDQD